MADVTEILVTTDNSSNLGSASIWNYKAGTSLHNYKGGGVITSNTVAFIRDNYFIGAERLKPLIHIWQINSQETAKQMKIIAPGPVTALDVSLDGNYCVAGIGEQLCVWHIPTGNLLANVTKHFQQITKILFSKNSTYVISAAEDGIVFVWKLNQLIAQVHSMTLEPLYSLTDHTLPIRDMCVSNSAKNAYLMTVSSDCTLKINQIDSGELLLSVVFDDSLTAVTCNNFGTHVFVGSTKGDIHEISLLNPPRSVTHHDLNNDKVCTFSGHSKNITALSVSTDGLYLASGAADAQVIIWHIPTKQKLKTITHKGSVTNVLFSMAMKNMFIEEYKPSIVFNTFKRNLVAEDNNQQVIEVIHSEDINFFNENVESNVKYLIQNPTLLQNTELQLEIERLKHINSQLYQYSVGCILEQKNDDKKNIPAKIKMSSPFEKNMKKRKH